MLKDHELAGGKQRRYIHWLALDTLAVISNEDTAATPCKVDGVQQFVHRCTLRHARCSEREKQPPVRRGRRRHEHNDCNRRPATSETFDRRTSIYFAYEHDGGPLRSHRVLKSTAIEILGQHSEPGIRSERTRQARTDNRIEAPDNNAYDAHKSARVSLVFRGVHPTRPTIFVWLARARVPRNTLIPREAKHCLGPLTDRPGVCGGTAAIREPAQGHQLPPMSANTDGRMSSRPSLWMAEDGASLSSPSSLDCRPQPVVEIVGLGPPTL